MQFVEGLGGQYGHEGEAIGWEGWAGHDPETGQTTVAVSVVPVFSKPKLVRGTKPVA